MARHFYGVILVRTYASTGGGVANLEPYSVSCSVRGSIPQGKEGPCATAVWGRGLTGHRGIPIPPLNCSSVSLPEAPSLLPPDLQRLDPF